MSSDCIPRTTICPQQCPRFFFLLSLHSTPTTNAAQGETNKQRSTLDARSHAQQPHDVTSPPFSLHTLPLPSQPPPQACLRATRSTSHLCLVQNAVAVPNRNSRIELSAFDRCALNNAVRDRRATHANTAQALSLPLILSLGAGGHAMLLVRRRRWGMVCRVCSWCDFACCGRGSWAVPTGAGQVM